jgi:hypothetical protein
MRRILVLGTVASVMVVMMAATAGAALADPPLVTGGGAQGEGATVFHCKPPGFKGVDANTPSGQFGGTRCFV